MNCYLEKSHTLKSGQQEGCGISKKPFWANNALLESAA